MKYHWIGFNQNNNNKDKNIELKIPEHTQILGSKNSVTDNKEEVFQPQIIQTVRSNSPVINMTKTQVTESCTQLLRKKIMDSDLLELAIGNCVIYNYRDSIIEIPAEEGTAWLTKSRQAQLRKNSALKACQQSLNSKNISNEIEKQLLLGICVSGKLK